MKAILKATWRRLPVPVRRMAHQVAGALSAAIRSMRPDNSYQTELRVRRWWAPQAQSPVIIVGFHGAVHGLGEGARMLAQGFRTQDLAVRTLDLSAQFGMTVEIPLIDPPPGSNERGTVISHINPPELLAWVAQTDGAQLRGRRHIGYWAWELETMPEDWRPAFDYVDEVWCPSDFAAAAIRASAPRRVKVSTAPYPMFLNPRAPADRSRFGFDADTVVVLMGFDLRSTAARKNPKGALRAFRAALAQSKGPAILLCKVVGGDIYPNALEALRAEAAAEPAIRLMTCNLSRQDMAVLIASSDIVLSLHRSEGYGLLLAEAIWAGKPLIATGWSANTEFMDQASSVAVDYRLEPVQDGEGIYLHGRWAIADEDDAAAKLVRLIDDQGLRRALSAATADNPHASFQAETWRTTFRGLLPLRGWARPRL